MASIGADREDKPMTMQDSKQQAFDEFFNTITLPALRGAEREIAAAEPIRRKIVAEVDAAYNAAEARRDASPEGWAMLTRIVNAIWGQDRARWWIDHQSYSAQSLLRSVGREIDEAVR